MDKVYLAFYKGKGNIIDRLIRFFTHGKYSHCEIVVDLGNGQFECYTSSPRDGGVRMKQMVLSNENWDFVDISYIIDFEQLQTYFDRTLGAKYDFVGAIGVVFGIRQSRSKFFCSEWCFNVLNGNDLGWRFSPNDLAALHAWALKGNSQSEVIAQ